eukprot:231761-Alexandrium_andersonii.AAC.1
MGLPRALPPCRFAPSVAACTALPLSSHRARAIAHPPTNARAHIVCSLPLLSFLPSHLAHALLH